MSSTRRGNFAKGFLLDPQGHKVTSARRLLGTATPAPSGSVNDFAPPIRDQAGKGQCTGEGSAGAFVTSCNAQGVKLPWKLASPSWNYKIARCVDRDDPNIPLTDDGAMPNQLVRGIQEFGMNAFEDCSDADADVNLEPTVPQLEKASRAHPMGWRAILTTGRERVLDIMRAIDPSFPKACPAKGGMAVCMSSDVDQAFEDYLGKGTISTVMKGEDLGGHFYYATEYQTTSSGMVIVRFRNSWTQDWGDQGCGWIDADFVIQRLSSLYLAYPEVRGAS